MEPHLERKDVTLKIMFLSFLFTVANVIPIFIPSTLAYIYGFNSPRDKERYGITRFHVLTAAFIGELIFSIISAPIFKFTGAFSDQPKIFWYIVISVFVLNYLCSVIFYFRRTKQKIVTF